MKRLLALVTAPAVLALSACGTTDAGSPDASLAVTAAFYPLQWATEQVGGDLVEVRGLTKPGAEPHDLELTPKAVAELAASDVVVYLAGFQPAVDDAVRTQAPNTGYDVSSAADLALAATDDGHDHANESADEHAEHAEHADETDDHAAAEGVDPHFWLDPVRLAAVVTAVGERFAEADPEHAEEYRTNAEATVADLDALDADYRAGLADCRSAELVTAHTAFGYLAQRYGLTQEGITGISPDAEPDAATLRDLVERVREDDVSTIYSETLVSPALAETVAREAGARVAVLDPLEGLTDASAGSDYLEVMRSNLTVLEQGQGCS